jgi:uncharacterized protein
MNLLLDVNVLLAGIWSTHPLHARAFDWLQDKAVVVCPVTELGFLRISTNKKAIGVEMEKAREALRRFIHETGAQRISDDLPALNSNPRTSDEVTDHYLADLAVKHGLKLATFDARLKHPSAELIF